MSDKQVVAKNIKPENTIIEDVKNTKDRTNQVEIISSYLLNQKNIFTPEKAYSGAAIFKEYKKLFNKYAGEIPDIPKNTFNIYLSKISNLPESKINCDGRKQGYYLDQLFEKIEPLEVENEEQEEQIQKEIREAKEKGNLLEKDLYQFLAQWLFLAKNEHVSDISNTRAQAKWGNPDLVGLKVNNLFGATEVEITTIEAKLTWENWEQWIFEAVAHTIFSNRSYFAFVHSRDHVNKILGTNMLHYAEMFNVGILLLTVEPEDYVKIKKRDAFSLTEDNHTIIEYSPAPFNSPHMKYKKKFLNGLGIQEPKDLYMFGKTLEK